MTLLNAADALRLGAATVGQAYLGATQVWPASAAPQYVISPTLGAHTMLKQSDSGGSSPATTAAIATQSHGSAFFAAIAGFAYTGTPTDSAGNTFTKFGPFGDIDGMWPNEGIQPWVAYGDGSAAHTLTLVKDSQWSGRELTMPFVEVRGASSGIITHKYDPTVGPTLSQSITVDGPALLIAVWNGDSGQYPANMTAVPQAPWHVIELYLDVPADSCDQQAVAVRQVQEAGTYTITWTQSPSQGSEMYIAAFYSDATPTFGALSETKKNATITLTNNDLTATMNASGGASANGSGMTDYSFDVEATPTYWEVRMDAIESGKFVNAGAVPANNTNFLNGLGVYAPGFGWNNDGSLDIWIPPASGTHETTNNPAYAVGDVLQFAVIDGDVYLGKNGTWVGDPDAETGATLTGLTGRWCPAIASYDAHTFTMTLNFGKAPFAYTPPARCGCLIAPAPSIALSWSLPSGKVGDAYTGSVTATLVDGATGPVTFTLTSLPPGVTQGSTTDNGDGTYTVAVSGTPTADATYSVGIAANGRAQSASDTASVLIVSASASVLPTLTGHAGVSTSARVSSLTFPFTGAGAGDYALVTVNRDGTTSPTTPTDWTLLNTGTSSVDGQRASIYGKALTSTDITAGSVTITLNGSNWATGTISTWSGVNAAGVTNTVNPKSTSNPKPVTMTALGVPSVGANSILVASFCRDSNDPHEGYPAAPSGWTLLDGTDDSLGWSNMSSSYTSQAAAGNAANATALDSTAGGGWIAFMVALPPA